MEIIKAYVGTYDINGSKGIYEFIFDIKKEQFLSSHIVYEILDAKYLSFHNGMLVFPFKKQKMGIGMIYQDMKFTYTFGNSVACHVTQDDKFIYTANYHDGTVGIFEKNKDGINLKKIINIQKKGGCHQVILTKKHILIPCLLLDKLEVYDKETLQYIKTSIFPVGSGPRHGVLHPDNKRLFVISELSCELFLLNEHYNIVKSWNLLDETVEGAGAAIRMSQEGRFLYISIRDVNKLYVFDIENEKVIQIIDCNGDHPRDIVLDPTEKFLFVANRFSNEIVVFRRDMQTGILQLLESRILVKEPVCIAFI